MNQDESPFSMSEEQFEKLTDFMEAVAEYAVARGTSVGVEKIQSYSDGRALKKEAARRALVGKP